MNNKEKVILYFLIISIIIGSAISLYKRQNERKKFNKIEFNKIEKVSNLEAISENSVIKTEKIRNQYPVNINQATKKEMEALPGIGPVIAQRIIDKRNRVGKFTRLEDLLKVKGIGPKTLQKMKDKIIIEN